MKRAAVAIGVEKYPAANLPTLQAAVSGAHDFAKWSVDNDCETKVITDENAPVTVYRVVEAVKEFVDRQGDEMIDQLILYFAGHGVNKSYDEQWLLSSAPVMTGEAINLPVSVSVARYVSAIPHVVFFSDACRTAADTISAQTVEGASAFPNYSRKALPSQVDVFYGSLPGHPTQEYKDAGDASANYEALYTKCLLEILNGEVPIVTEQLDEGGRSYRVLAAKPLGALLDDLVPKLAVKMKLKRNQEPNAIPVSELPLYVARFDESARVRQRGGGGSPGPRPELLRRTSLPFVVTTAAIADFHVSNVILKSSLPPPELTDSAGATRFAEDKQQLEKSDASGKVAFETGCGFSVVGKRVEAVLTGRWPVWDREVRPDGGLNFNLAPGEGMRSALVLIALEDAVCLLPTFRDYIGTLTFRDRELANVSYVPARNTKLWPIYEENASVVQEIRASIATAAYHGILQMERGSAKELANRWRQFKAIDPTLGIYSCYAFNQIGALDDIVSLAKHVREHLGVVPFDIRLLAQPAALQDPIRFRAAFPAADGEFPPSFPLLAQGWGLVGASGIELPEPLNQAQAHLLPSLWTLFDKPALPLLEEVLTLEAER